MERRRHFRLKAHFDVLYSASGREGSGTLTEISHTGLRVEGTLNPPKEGALVRVYVFIQPVSPFEVAGHVAWAGEDSFALHYDNFDADVRQLVDDIAAIVGPAGAA